MQGALSRLRPKTPALQEAERSNIWPPPIPQPITQAERERHLQEAREAARISNDIDQSLAKEKTDRLKNIPRIRILLLGQAESGKSTTLKAFKLQYAPRQFAAELDLWTAVILLNLVRSINVILDILESHESDFANSRPRGGSPTLVMTDNLRRLRLMLAPLQRVESSIRKRISPDGGDDISSSNDPRKSAPSSLRRKSSKPELSVRAVAGGGWFSVALKPSQHPGGIPTAAIEKDFMESVRVIRALTKEMKMIWGDETVLLILKKYHVNLREQSGFFLDDIDRLTSPNYRPSTEDVLRARLKTCGAIEHRLDVEQGSDTGKQWLFIDVNGSCRQRLTWASYFDNVNSIIFLAPVSTFNQTLDEDRNMNRLEDSFLLWKDICSNKLLANVTMILFLNKIDILAQKLADGIEFRRYVSSYRGENNYADIIDYLQSKFTSIHHQHSPTRRSLSIFVTSVINHLTTPRVLARVHASIIQNMLAMTGML